MDSRLSCYACGRTAPLDASPRCDCGEPRWLELAGNVEWPPATDAGGMWRFDSLLPVGPPDGLGAAAGGTPLVRTASLDEEAGARVHLKYEGANPTGSFKDRGSALTLADALSRGVEALGTVSHGNMGKSVAAHAASGGLDCVVLVPADVPPERLDAIARYGPAVSRVAGDYGRLYEETLGLGPELGVEFSNSDSPLRVEGQKTTALELCAAAPPDAIVLPASSGGHASGTWKALRELDAAGAIAEVPRLYLAQTAACAPIAEAYEAGREVERVDDPADTVAYSIANPDPPSGNRALAAVEATDGAVVAVDDEAILDAQATLARRTGFRVETASATTLAAIRELRGRGAFDADEDVVLVATGGGFGEPSEATDVDAPRVELDDLRAHLESQRGI